MKIYQSKLLWAQQFTKGKTCH